MTCQRRTAALIDLAASGAEPNAELRSHLQNCPSCHAVFQRERHLFASIDKSLRGSANAEVPVAFVQRVRAAVNRQPAPTSVSFFRPRVAYALAAASIILFFFAYSTRRAKVEPQDSSIARRQPSSDAVLPNPPAPAVDSAATRATPSLVETRRTRTVTGNLQSSSSAARASRDPEILVSNDQEVLLARYAEQLRWPSSLPTLAAVPASEVDLSQTPALQFSPIQIAQLDVKPLAERQE